MVCFSTQNLTVIGKKGPVQGSPKSKFTQNCGFRPPEADTMNTFTYNLACKPSASLFLPSLYYFLPTFPISLSLSPSSHTTSVFLPHFTFFLPTFLFPPLSPLFPLSPFHLFFPCLFLPLYFSAPHPILPSPSCSLSLLPSPFFPRLSFISLPRHVSVDVQSALAHQMLPSSVKGGRYRSPQKSKFAKLWFSATGSRHNEHIHMKFGV